MDRIPIVSLIKYKKKELKETLGNKSVAFLDWERFCWIGRQKGRPIQDPEWPNNFLKSVRALVYDTEGSRKYKDLKYIFLNAGCELIKKIIEDKIPVIIVMPRKFEGRYSPVEHYQYLNKKYLELDMPMLYLEDKDMIPVFSKESTYKYLRDKTEFVEGFRFGTCDFLEDIEEMTAMYENIDNDNSYKDIMKKEDPGHLIIVRDDNSNAIIKNTLFDALTTAGDCAKMDIDHEYFIKDSNDNTIICRISINNDGDIVIKNADS